MAEAFAEAFLLESRWRAEPLLDWGVELKGNCALPSCLEWLADWDRDLVGSDFCFDDFFKCIFWLLGAYLVGANLATLLWTGC